MKGFRCSLLVSLILTVFKVQGNRVQSQRRRAPKVRTRDDNPYYELEDVNRTSTVRTHNIEDLVFLLHIWCNLCSLSR